MKKTIIAALMMILSMASMAQSGTNSPYSQYGLGVLSDQTSGFNRGMNGLGYGFREHNQVNFLNPASYASVDSLTFIFDAGISGQITNFSEKGVKVNANNANIEYVVAGLKLHKRLGVSFGILPFTNVGYDYSSSANVGSSSDDNTTTVYSNTYSGSGGLHQVYLGFGWMPFKGFAVGVNGGYLWGSYSRSVVNSYSDSYVNTLSKYYSATVNSYKLDFGLQYTARLSRNDNVTIGLTYSLGHGIGGDPECKVISLNAQTAVSDTALYKSDKGLEIPAVYGAGFVWSHANRLKIGADYTLQKWSSASFPQYSVVNDVPQYKSSGALFSDRHKVTVGGEFCPNETGRKFFQRIHYRLGASYATSYLKIGGLDGPKEYSVSAGFGIPVINTYNNRSLLNVSAQWVRQDTKTFITENSFRINIGLTFNERWFAKWKME